MLLRDRSVRDTEIIYAVLKKLTPGEEYDIVHEQYMLAVQLMRINDELYSSLLPGGSNRDEPAGGYKGALSSRVDQLMALPRPVYQGLLEACRAFEYQNRYMMEHALDSDFWKPGGPV